MLIKENSSRIRLLKKAILPSVAFPRFSRVTPERLYHPRPLAIARFSPSPYLVKKLKIRPPRRLPMIVPIGIIKIFT